jgi:pantetheine-phosphate adenylyltransferase
MEIAFAGSFDPITYGHLDIIKRLEKLFEVTVVVAKNDGKKNLFKSYERIELVKENLENSTTNVIECPDNILLYDFLNQQGIHLLARGVRESYDFIQEMTMSHINLDLSSGKLETIFFPTNKQFSDISSSAVKSIAALNGNILNMVPANVAQAIFSKQEEVRNGQQSDNRYRNP